jgi:hypothetical protein
VIDSLCRTLLGVHARINQEKMRTLDEQHNGRKKIIRYKTDLSIEINRDSYNHVGSLPHFLLETKNKVFESLLLYQIQNEIEK